MGNSPASRRKSTGLDRKGKSPKRTSESTRGGESHDITLPVPTPTPSPVDVEPEATDGDNPAEEELKKATQSPVSRSSVEVTPVGTSPEGGDGSPPQEEVQSRELPSNTQGQDEDEDLYIVKHDYLTQQDGQLSIKKRETVKVLQMNENGDWCEVANCQGEIGWVPMSFISKVDSLEKHPWYHGNITRAEAELTLSSDINGSFLVRESESKRGKYSISLRYDGRVFHYQIHSEPSTGRRYVTPEHMFQTLDELIIHHSKHPDGLTTTLDHPVPDPNKLN